MLEHGSVSKPNGATDGATRLLRTVAPRTWLRAGAIGVVAALVIGLPTDVVPNPVFGRSSIPVRWWDPVVLVATSFLIGLVLALRPSDVADGDHEEVTASADGDDRRVLLGGVGGLLAVGCPTCNHLVVAVIGTSGALSFFQPIQPILALASVGLLGWAVRRRVRDLRDPSCPVPTAR